MKNLTVEEAKTEKGYCVFRYDPDLDGLVLEEAELPAGMQAPVIDLTEEQRAELKNASGKMREFRVFAAPVTGAVQSSG